MKKLCLALFVLFLSSTILNAQGNTSFGLTGGYINGSGKATISGFDVATVSDGSGFFIGLLAEIEVTDKFYVQPEVFYGGIDGEGAIFIPVMAKYYIADKFNIQAGPQLDFITGLNDLEKELINTTGFSLSFGAGFDITDNFAVQGRYNVGLNNRIDGNISSFLDALDIPNIGNLVNPDLKVNTFQIGVVYKFN
ncbi:MAG: PorT family protein [Flavobacteriaceae bacterium]|nr:PorT family protein [Flavobacteriaceae bacterium]